MCYLLSRVWFFVILWTVASQAPLSMEFSRQEYWSGLPFPSPGDLPDSGIELRSPSLQVDALPSEPPGNPIMYNIQSIQIITLWTVKIKSHHLNKTKSQVFASFLSSHLVLMPEIMVRNYIPNNQSRNRYIKVCISVCSLELKTV